MTPAPPEPGRQALRLLEALAGILLAVAGAVLGAWELLPPLPLAADTDADRFSAERAMAHVRALATEPRMIGSEANRAARRDLVEGLEELGLEVELQRARVIYDHPLRSETRTRVAWPVNIVARLPGSGERRGAGEALALMTHYDSVPTSPGAADAASGVAVVLEVLRALRADDAPLDRDLLVIITDGEEVGLMGAQAFFAEHPAARELGLLLNFEARGASGPARLFETGPGNGPLLRAFRDLAPHPVAASVGVEVYRRMPNDTDGTIALAAQVPLLNFAFIGDFPRYHTGADRPEHLSARSLQHAGANALAVIRGLGDAELPAGGGEATFFNLSRDWLVVYDEAGAVLLAVLAIALVLLALVTGFAQGPLTLGNLASGAVWLAVAVISGYWLTGALHAAAGAGAAPFQLLYAGPLLFLAWMLLAVTIAGLCWVSGARLRRYGLAALGALALLAGALTGTLTLAGLVPAGILALALLRPIAPETGALLAAQLLVMAILTAVTVALVPHAAYVFAWPTLATGFAALAWWTGLLRSAALVGGLALAASLLFWTPLLHGVYLALGLTAPALLAPLALLALAPGAPLLRTVLRAPLVVATAIAGPALILFVALHEPYSVDRPRPVELFYALDAASGTAYWMTRYPRPAAWTRSVLGDAALNEPGAAWGHSGDERSWRAPAPGLDLGPIASASAVAHRSPRGFGLRITLRPAVPGSRLRLRLPAAAYTQALLAGRRVPLPELDGPWEWEFWGAPAGPLLLEVRGRGAAPSALVFEELRYRWPDAVDALVPVRDPHLMSGPWALDRGLWIRHRVVVAAEDDAAPAPR